MEKKKLTWTEALIEENKVLRMKAIATKAIRILGLGSSVKMRAKFKLTLFLEECAS